MTAKVFIIGLGKTGTTSVGCALGKLGYRNKTFDPELVLAYRNGAAAPINAALTNYDSFDDFPWPLMFEELATRFPDAKFILTMRRNKDVWFRSLSQHAWRAPDGTYRKVGYGVEQPQFHRRRMLSIYTRHTETVRAFFADEPDRLLTMCLDNDDGWVKLCSFLGKPVPPTAFIHANKTPPFQISTAQKLRRMLGYYKRLTHEGIRGLLE